MTADSDIWQSWAREGMLWLGGSTPDNVFCLIYDLEVKQSSPVHLSLHKLMKQMHYLLLKEQNPEPEQRLGKNHWKFPKAERRNAFSSFPRYFACQPEACSKYNISWIKDYCSAFGNVSRWVWQSLRSNSGIKETVAYLDQRWAGMLAVRAVWKD